MLAPFFHSWERRLADVTNNRVVRPFDWGHDWFCAGQEAGDLEQYVARVLNDTDSFYTPAPTDNYELRPAADDEPGGDPEGECEGGVAERRDAAGVEHPR